MGPPVGTSESTLSQGGNVGVSILAGRQQLLAPLPPSFSSLYYEVRVTRGRHASLQRRPL